jgi:hypothetical protein
MRRPGVVDVRPCEAVEEEAAAVADEAVTAAVEMTAEDGTVGCEELGEVAEDGGAVVDREKDEEEEEEEDGGGVSGVRGDEAAGADDEQDSIDNERRS